MGNIDSLHLFGDTELMILALYKHNKHKWNKVLDIGANIGLHSICMAKMGFDVKAYEPDPHHFTKLVENLARNQANRVQPYCAAVHTKDGSAQFVRVLNNLTGNHLEGFKDSYGPRESIPVVTVDCRPLWGWADFAKIDSEGNEAALCLTMTKDDLSHLQAVLEVRNEANARIIYDHFNFISVPMWSQKTEWAEVKEFKDMPKQNREGSLFIGHSPPWE
jgi:FkbM family methyltransferase